MNLFLGFKENWINLQVLYLLIVEVEKIAVAVEEPVALLNVLHRQKLTEAVVRHMAE